MSGAVRAAAVVVLVVLGALLSADLGIAGAPPPLRPAWRKNLADNEFFLRYGPLEPAGPADAGDKLSVIVGASDGILRRVSLRDGGQVWSKDLGGGPRGRVTVVGDRVYLASDDGHVFALAASNGREIWRERAGGAVVAGPVVVQGLLLFVTDEDNLRVLHADTGKWAWDYSRDTPDGFILYGASEPVVHAGRVLMGYADGSLVSLLLADGSLVWRQDLTAGKTEFTDVDGRPVVDAEGGQVFAASYSGGVHCLGLEDGEIRWRTDVRGSGSPVLDEGRLLVPTAEGRLVALDAASGRVHYRSKLAESGALGPLVRVGGLWATASRTLGLLVVDGATGRVVQRFDGGSGVSAQPAVIGTTLVLLSNGGWLYGFRVG